MRAMFLVSSLVLVMATGSGCQPTAEKIETWKGTQRGPQKLRDTVTDNGVDPHLRGLAVTALVEIGMGTEALHDLSTVPPDKKTAIIHEAVGPLTALLGPSLTQPMAPSQSQKSAKDALFGLRDDAAPVDRTKLDDVLVQWTTVDLAGRSSLGGASSEKILRAIGPKAAAALVPLVSVGPNLVAAQLIGELGDRDAQAKAAAALIAQARHATAPSENVLHALGLIGGVSTSAYLVEVAQSSTAIADLRQKALYALAQGSIAADERALTAAIAIASDTRAPGGVREAAFQVAEKIGPAAVGGLTKLFVANDSTLRFRAIEAALKAGGAQGVGHVLSAIPDDQPWTSADLDSYVVHDLTLLGKDGPAALVDAAQHPPVIGQIAALRALAKVGTKRDPKLPPTLVANTSRPKALTPSTTVGQEARLTNVAIAARP